MNGEPKKIIDRMQAILVALARENKTRMLQQERLRGHAQKHDDRMAGKAGEAAAPKAEDAMRSPQDFKPAQSVNIQVSTDFLSAQSTYVQEVMNSMSRQRQRTLAGFREWRGRCSRHTRRRPCTRVARPC